MMLILFLIISGLIAFYWLFKKSGFKYPLREAPPPKQNQSTGSRNRQTDLLDETKKSLQIEIRSSLSEPVLFRFIGEPDILEVIIYLEIWNNGIHSLTLQKITWDFWVKGLHIKSGTHPNKIQIDSAKPGQVICLRESLLESQIADVLWASQKADCSGYLEGNAYCETKYGHFQKKFNFLKVNFTVSGQATEKPKDSTDKVYLDGLTKLHQRGYIEENLQNIIDRNIHRSPVSFAMLDIDNFKKINDEHGHLAGDEVLRAVCEIIKDTLPDRGIAVRYGGDEIAVLLVNCGLEESRSIMETLRDKIEKHDFIVQEGVVRATVSIGVATLTEQANFKVLVRIADNMLAFSKQDGKNRVSVHLRKIEPLN